MEQDWIRETVMAILNEEEASTRVQGLKELKKVSHIPWIRSLVMSFVEEIIQDEKEWMQALTDFKSDLIAAEKNAKLTQF